MTQTLPVLPDPPAAISADTSKLVFHVSPLSAKGLLSQQIRDALKAIEKAKGGATLVKIRAFVAGNGDLRRVQQIVTEDFSERRIPLPVVTTIQAGGLPLTGAQVVIEAISTGKSSVNPNGLVFFEASGPPGGKQAVSQLQSAAQGMAMLRVTCFLNSVEEAAQARADVAAAFPAAAANFVQLTRFGIGQAVTCEGIARPTKATGLSGAIALNSQKVVFTGLQMAFRDQDADLRLAFERLTKAIGSVGAKESDMLMLTAYTLNRTVEEKARALRPAAPYLVSHLVEGLPSVDASMAVEALAAAR